MNVTVNHPGTMTVAPEQVTSGRTLVYADGDDQYHALVLWITPVVAAQWIEALTPLAAEAQQ